MKCWIARSASGTHFRVQLEPFTYSWQGWDIAESEISEDDWLEMSNTPDEIEMERLHQEVWLRRSGLLLNFAGVGPRRDLT